MKTGIMKMYGIGFFFLRRFEKVFQFFEIFTSLKNYSTNFQKSNTNGNSDH